MNGAAPRSRQSSGTCDKCAISELPPEVRSAGQCIEEAFRERLLLSDLKRLWARQSRGAALGCIFERHRIFVFREAERHEEGRIIDLESQELAGRRSLQRQEEMKRDLLVFEHRASTFAVIQTCGWARAELL